MDDEQTCGKILDQLAYLRRKFYNREDKMLLVHGGGKRITQALKEKDIETRFYKGQRITDANSMKVIKFVLGEQINRKLAGALQKMGCDVVRGDEVLLMECETWKPKDGEESLGQVGKVIEVHPLESADLTNKIAVIAPIGYNKERKISYNINADWAAAEIAVKFSASLLFYITDQDGILDRSQQTIPKIKTHEVHDLIDNGVITDGMIPKVLSMKDSLERGVEKIVVINGLRKHNLVRKTEENVHFPSATLLCR